MSNATLEPAQIQSIATVIYRQLGGDRIRCMVKVKAALSMEEGGLQLDFSNPVQRVNCVQIVLDSDRDLYTVTFFYKRGCECRQVAKVSGIYADMLKDTFESRTGLLLSF